MICTKCITYVCQCHGGAVGLAYNNLINECDDKIKKVGVEMKNKHYTGKPSVNHVPCSVIGCKNFYNIQEKKLQTKCKPCRENDKKKRH